MTSKYMNFSPQLVNERNVALNNCPTKSGRSQIYRTYYLKMKDAYEKHEEEIEAEEYYDDEDEDDEDYEEEEEEDDCEEEYEEDDEEDAEDEEPENEVIDTNATEYCCCGANEVEANEVDEDEVEVQVEEENVFGCAGCNYEWRDGYKNGWRDAMKYITNKTHKEVPDTPACSYCDIVCKTRKCGGKCGGTVRYCSVNCQKQDWAYGHKDECGK